jgi:hypothetical protein
MVIRYFVSGFLVKLITGIDDTLIQIPVISHLTKRKKGRIIYSLGILTAIIIAIFLSVLFASTIKFFPYSNYISAILIFLLAIAIQFNLFINKPREGVEKKLKKVKKITVRRIAKVFGIGFITAFATVIDDVIAYSSLFLHGTFTFIYVILGILSATFLELFIIIYGAKSIQGIKWKKEISVIGLIILGFLILFNIL